MKKNVHEIEIKLEKEWIDSLDKAFNKKVKEVKVDGFRKGHAPKEIFLKKFGIEYLYDEAINFAMKDAYKKVFEENKLTPVISPSVDVVGISDSNVILKFIIITTPEIKLGEYKNLGVKKEKITITNEEIEKQINSLKNNYAEQIIKKDGKVEKGDTVVIDFVGYVDGEKLESGTGNDYPLEIGSNSFIPGFEEKLIGAKLNDELKLELKFPENYVEHLKNKDVKFDVKIKEITVKQLPELNKDFYEDLGYTDILTEKDFKDKVKKDIESQKQAQNEDIFIEKCLEKAVKNMEVDVNEEIIVEEIHRMIEQYERQLQMQGMNLDTYYQMTGTTHEDLHKQMEKEAEKRIKYRYLIEKVAEVEKVDFTQKEIDAKIKEMAENYGITKKELLEAYGSNDIIKYDMKMHEALKIIKESN